MKTLLLLALIAFGGDNATGTMPPMDVAEEPLYVIMDAPPPNLSAAAVPPEVPQADSLWEWPRQFCGLLSEAPAGMTWGFIALVVSHWAALTWVVTSRTRLRALYDGRSEVLEEQHHHRCTAPLRLVGGDAEKAAWDRFGGKVKTPNAL
ncbi:hypothetical protein [Verrucomicrobium spinosum]|uniref:hypothetical protein n=1 Tax=Verrucomicrobium spinosum TaxID=2736 RepID=UPI0001745C07|nr:hypothetical protein [Verrucomicrobium spinosum]